MSKIPFCHKEEGSNYFSLFSIKFSLSDYAKRNVFFPVVMSDYEQYFPLSRSFNHPAFMRGNGRGRLVSEYKILSQQNLSFISMLVGLLLATRFLFLLYFLS